MKVAFPRPRDYVSDLREEPKVFGFILWLFLFSLHWGAEVTCYGLFLSHRLGLSMTGMGWYMGFEFLALALTCLWAGPRCDRGADPKTMAIAGLIISGTGQMLMCIPVLWLSVLCRAFHGVGDGLIFMVMYTGIARLFIPSRVGGHNSALSLVMMTGMFAGSLVFSPLGERFGYEIPLIITGALVGVLAFPIFYAGKGKRATGPAPVVDPVPPTTQRP